MTEYIASSELVGRRPRISRIFWYSSALRPRSAQGCSWSGSLAATATVSSTASIYRRQAPRLTSRPEGGSGDFLPRVVLGEEPVDAGLVEAGDDVLVLLRVAHALGEREGGGDEEEGPESEEGLGPRLVGEVVDRDQHRHQRDGERGSRLGVEGGGGLVGR